MSKSFEKVIQKIIAHQQEFFSTSTPAEILAREVDWRENRGPADVGDLLFMNVALAHAKGVNLAKLVEIKIAERELLRARERELAAAGEDVR